MGNSYFICGQFHQVVDSDCPTIGQGWHFFHLQYKRLIILLMKGIVRDDKNVADQTGGEDIEKDRKIKRLTQINRELIETLKQQNEQLTKKISKQRLKGGRTTSVKSSPNKGSFKQVESIRKQLSNAYKQIDMYKNTLQNLKAKEVSLDNVEKINELDNKVKNQDTIIQNYQKELKYLAGLREKQERELKIYQNQEIKQTKTAIEKEITQLKQKMKTLKKNAIKREEIQKRQHAYYVELEQALRKANDDYYPGKVEKKDIDKNQDNDIGEKEWQAVKNKLAELRKLYQQNNKKLDLISRQKNRQLKSLEENQLKLKQKMRKLNTLKSRISELTKLTVIKQSKQIKEPSKPQPLPKRQQIVKNDKNKVTEQRQVKKWNVPQGFCLQKGKVLPNSTFISDKNQLSSQHKFRIVEANVWTDGSGTPCLFKFFYQNEDNDLIEGKDMVQNYPSNLQMTAYVLKQKDYLWHISGAFSNGVLSSLTLKSKLGQEMTFQDDNAQHGEKFTFFSKPNDIPSCFYGATIKVRDNQIKICYLGCEFMSDW